MHATTQQVKDQVESMLDGRELSSEQKKKLQGYYDELDDWMGQKPDWIRDENITATVKDVKEDGGQSMLD